MQKELCVSEFPCIYCQNRLAFLNKSAFIVRYNISLISFSQKYVRKKKRGNISLCSQKKTYIHRQKKKNIYIYIYICICRLLYFIMNWFTSCWEVI